MRKIGLFISGLVQYFRIRYRNKSKFLQNNLATICELKPLLYAKNESELMFILETLVPIASHISKSNLSLDMSLVLLNMSALPAEIHFSIKNSGINHKAHAWVEASGTLLSTDYKYDTDSVWSWQKQALKAAALS